MRRALHVQRSNADYMQRAVDSLRASMRARQLKMPKGREAIARCALKQSGAFTILDLVRALKREGVAGAHAVTVYRTIPLLVEAGLLRETAGVSGDSRLYEVAFEREIRPLLNCRACRRTFDLSSSALVVLTREAQRFGFELDVTALMGRCGSCV